MRRALRRLASCRIRQPPGWASAAAVAPVGRRRPRLARLGGQRRPNAARAGTALSRTDLLAGGESGLRRRSRQIGPRQTGHRPSGRGSWRARVGLASVDAVTTCVRCRGGSRPAAYRPGCSHGRRSRRSCPPTCRSPGTGDRSATSARPREHVGPPDAVGVPELALRLVGRKRVRHPERDGPS